MKWNIPVPTSYIYKFYMLAFNLTWARFYFSHIHCGNGVTANVICETYWYFQFSKLQTKNILAAYSKLKCVLGNAIHCTHTHSINELCFFCAFIKLYKYCQCVVLPRVYTWYDPFILLGLGNNFFVASSNWWHTQVYAKVMHFVNAVHTMAFIYLPILYYPPPRISHRVKVHCVDHQLYNRVEYSNVGIIKCAHK